MNTLFNIILSSSNSAYGLYHIICLVIAIALIVVGSIYLKKIDLNAATMVMLIIGAISETLKVCSYIVKNYEELGGYLPKTDLPFHLCSIQIIFLIIIRLTKEERVKRLLLGFMIPTCLVGGAAALLLPTSSSLNMPVITMQYFIYHAGIIWFAIYLLMSKEFVLTMKDYVNTLKLLVVIGFVAIYLNSWVNDYENNINFMYVVKPPADNLPLLNTNHGWLVYIIHYGCIAVFAISCVYMKPIMNAIKKKYKTIK